MPASWLKYAAPLVASAGRARPAAALRRGDLQADPDQQREQRDDEQQQLVAPRKKMIRSSLGKKRRSARTDAGWLPAVPWLRRGASRVWLDQLDIEALPGEADEQVLEARRLHRQAAHPDARVDELRADDLGLPCRRAPR